MMAFGTQIQHGPYLPNTNNPAPSPSGHPLLSGPPTLNDIHQIFTPPHPHPTHVYPSICRANRRFDQLDKSLSYQLEG